jgi:ketosteroid isomerase-like protein
MKVLLSVVAGVVLSLLTTSQAWSQAAAVSIHPEFGPFLYRFEDGIRRFINGDGRSWKQNASHRDDVTIMGAWGAHEKGWREVEARYDWAAARFLESGAAPTFEYLASGVSGDLAFTVAIERSRARVIGQKETASMPLRVTHIFRREEGTWKLIHRHADPLTAKTAPDSVLKK